LLALTCGVLGAAIGVVIFQLGQILAERTRLRHGPQAATSRHTLEEFGLGHRLRHRPSQLSGGERQRTAIARALASEPGILMADEPTGNLDATTGREILDLLKKRHDAGLTIVMVTHDPTVAEYADRVVQLEDGRVVETTA
jgi:predicted ABC-type transport system involved in lysophospholipase L1 biosynthesis ATPase subunit